MGFPVFAVVSEALGATRRDHRPVRDHLSSLCEGPHARVQRANLALWGALAAVHAAGLRDALGSRSVAGRWTPRLAATSAAGLGILAASGSPSARPRVHLAGAAVSFIAWPAGALLLVPHLARHPRWRGWASGTVAAVAGTWTLGYAAGRTIGTAPSGLLERLAIAASGTWSAAFAARLLRGVTAPTRNARAG